MEKVIDYKNYEFLTETQREVYLARKSGATFSSIAAEKGVNPQAVRSSYMRAERRVREYEKFHDVKERNMELVDISITRGELKIMREALYDLRLKHDNKVRRVFVSDWAGRYPYEYKIICDFYEKVEETLKNLQK